MRGEPIEAESNTVEMPAVVTKAYAVVGKLSAESRPFSSAEYQDELFDSLLWGAEAGTPEADEQTTLRTHTRLWALRELEVLKPSQTYGLYYLQIVLTTLSVSAQSALGAVQAISQDKIHVELLDGLVLLLKATGIFSPSRHVNFDEELREKAMAAGRNGDYREIGSLVRHLEMEPTPDINLAILLLKRFSPERLAQYIEERRDIFFSAMVRDTLADAALEFSLSVSDTSFKFVCASSIADMRLAVAPMDSVERTVEVLLQIAQSGSWQAWLGDFARYPQPGTVGEKALSEALTKLSSTYWAAFVDSVELGKNSIITGAVVGILVPFLHALGNEESAEMWRLAFERWNKWDYGLGEQDAHLLAPATCSFDFPIAMHYSRLPLQECLDEEARLLECIATAEQKWFTDLSELATYRNRLSSRLRLLQHGLSIRNSSSSEVNALPPPIQPESEYARIRFRYFDASAMGRN